jgi:1-deoxy-D-xylulose-5-phosphate synthase
MTWRCKVCPVRLCMDRGGLSGDDGPTHHGLFDIGYLRHIPASSTCSRRTRTSSSTCSTPWPPTTPARPPSATRAAPSRAPRQTKRPHLLEIGKAEVVADGTDVALFGLGTMFEMAERTKALLEAKGSRSP